MNSIQRRDVANPDKIIFYVANAVFVSSWVLLCVGFARHWHGMSQRMHWDGVFLLAMFIMLWFYLLRERHSSWCLFVAAFTLVSVTNLVPSGF
jgi:hypothetical protein